MNDQDSTSSCPSSGYVPRLNAIVRVVPIVNKKGLHARASARFVQLVEKFEADVKVTRGAETVGGTSIMGLMMLAAGPGTKIIIDAVGPQAKDVVAALETLLANRFGEED